MLDSASTHTMIAVKDLERAKAFYGGKLGLTATDERPGAGIRYDAHDGTWFLVYVSSFAGTAQSTCMRLRSTTSRALASPGPRPAGRR